MILKLPWTILSFSCVLRDIDRAITMRKGIDVRGNSVVLCNKDSALFPVLVPLCLTHNQNQESARKRTLVQALRFIAHINGASLLFCSTREKNLKDVFRQTLNSVRSAARQESLALRCCRLACYGRFSNTQAHRHATLTRIGLAKHP